MRLEIIHDLLAEEVYNSMTRSAPELVQLREKETFVHTQHEFYLENQSLLTKKELQDIEPFLELMQITEEERSYIRLSQANVRRQERNRLILWASLFSVLVLGITLTTILYIKAEQNAKEARRQANIAESGRLAVLSEIETQNRNRTDALRLLGLALPIIERPLPATFSTALVDAFHAQQENIPIMVGDFHHPTAVRWADISPDHEHIITIDENNNIRLWESTGKLLDSVLIFKDTILFEALFTSDNKRVAIATNKAGTVLWNIENKALEFLTNSEPRIGAIDLSPDGHLLMSRSSSGKIDVFQLPGNDLLISVPARSGNPLPELYWKSPSQFYIAVRGKLGQITALYDQAGVLQTDTILPVSNTLERSLLFAPKAKHDDYKIEISTESDVISLGRLPGDSTNTITPIDLRKHKDIINGFKVTDDQEYLLSWSEDSTAQLWSFDLGILNRKTSALVGQWPGLIGSNSDLVFLYNKDSIESWDAEQNMARTVYQSGPERSIEYAALLSTKPQLLISLNNGEIVLWDYQEQRAVQTWNFAFTPSSLAVNSAGSKAVAGSLEGAIHIWDLEKQDAPTSFSIHDANIFSVAFSPDGQNILSGSGDFLVKITNIKGEILHTLEGHSFYVLGATYSTDGQFITSYSSDETARVWKASGEFLFEIGKGDEKFDLAMFTPDGSNVLSVQTSTGKASLWSLDQREIATYLFSPKLRWIWITPDNKEIITSSLGKDAQTWLMPDVLYDWLETTQLTPFSEEEKQSYNIQ